jgi:ribonuclease E
MGNANGNGNESNMQNESPSEGAGTSGRRERRPRNRGGRDRNERPNDETATRELFTAAESAKEPTSSSPAEPVATTLIAEVSVAAPEVPLESVTPTPAVEVISASPVETPAAAAVPQVEAFVLPVESLAQVAEQAGLVWVNSDADKIAAAQAAIAATPAPVHVPRERPPLLVVDAGPLVLVETRRQLGQDA